MPESLGFHPAFLSPSDGAEMPRVFVVDKVHPSGLALLRQRPGITVETLEAPTPATLLEGARAADGIVIRTSPLPGEAIAAAPHLKVVSRHGVGYDNVDLPALNARRIPLAVVGSVNAVSVAEHALYLLLATMKCGAAYDRAVRGGPLEFPQQPRGAGDRRQDPADPGLWAHRPGGGAPRRGLRHADPGP